jgi:NAD-dependent SIR2 family protein deacetylase
MPENIVYFLGAGASKNFGYPLTGQIMPEIIQALKKNDLFELGNTKTGKEAKLEKDLLEFLYILYPGLRNINLQKEKKHIPNITEVLSLIDHCCFYNIPPHPALCDETLMSFRQLLNRAVGELLLYYEVIPYTKTEEDLLKTFIGPLKKENKNAIITVITTNYDLVIDREFSKHIIGHQVDFGIAYRDIKTSKIVFQPANPLFRYYKLHGSLNWTRCDLCGHYYINPYGSIVHQTYKQRSDSNNTCVCSDRMRLKSVLVAPSLVRDIRDSNLLQIWKASMEAIRTADKLIFIGYSLPAEDLAIKSIIMRGLNGRDKKQKLQVDVVQHGEDAKPNYINLFGRDIEYCADGLKKYLKKSVLMV